MAAARQECRVCFMNKRPPPSCGTENPICKSAVPSSCNAELDYERSLTCTLNFEEDAPSFTVEPSNPKNAEKKHGRFCRRILNTVHRVSHLRYPLDQSSSARWTQAFAGIPMWRGSGAAPGP